MPYIDDNTKYEFVKFKDGKEVFAMVRESNGDLELHFPMNITLQPALTGGVLVNLGPYIPFTTEDSIRIEKASVLFRTSINDKFIDFYDEACTAWLNIRDNDKIDIKSSRQVYEESQQMLNFLYSRTPVKTISSISSSNKQTSIPFFLYISSKGEYLIVFLFEPVI